MTEQRQRHKRAGWAIGKRKPIEIERGGVSSGTILKGLCGEHQFATDRIGCPATQEHHSISMQKRRLETLRQMGTFTKIGAGVAVESPHEVSPYSMVLGTRLGQQHCEGFIIAIEPDAQQVTLKQLP